MSQYRISPPKLILNSILANSPSHVTSFQLSNHFEILYRIMVWNDYATEKYFTGKRDSMRFGLLGRRMRGNPITHGNKLCRNILHLTTTLFIFSVKWYYCTFLQMWNVQNVMISVLFLTYFCRQRTRWFNWLASGNVWWYAITWSIDDPFPWRTFTLNSNMSEPCRGMEVGIFTDSGMYRYSAGWLIHLS